MTELEVPAFTENADIAQLAEETVVSGPDRADAPVSEVTERFLRAIIARVPLDRIEELHLFAPLRQGGAETGIAVVAARAPVALVAPAAFDAPAALDAPELLVEPLDESSIDDEPDLATSSDAVTNQPLVAGVHRHTVYTARYRLVLKGPDRGKWEADVVDEADAPLVTVEMVVRGVQRRAGEDTVILRYSDAQIARALRIELPSA